MRAVAEELYGIPPEQVIGSSTRMKVEAVDGQPVLRKLPELGSFDDREEKVVNIALHIGRRPIFAFGNSDGDLAMLRYTLAGTGRAWPGICTMTMPSANSPTIATSSSAR